SLLTTPAAGNFSPQIVETPIFATKLPCPRGGDTTTHAKEAALSPWTGQQRRMRPTGLGVRSASVWCPEPVTPLDPPTCRPHGLAPASQQKPRTQGRLALPGASPTPPCAEGRSMDVVLTHGAGLDGQKKSSTACRSVP